jgi:hypothetical protein
MPRVLSPRLRRRRYDPRVTVGPRNPKNAAGHFYVLQYECISCAAPRAEAPGLVTLDDEVGCFFHRQPEIADEVNDAIRAISTSCVGAYRYGGNDPAIRRRLAELGHASACDHPLEGHASVLRNCVRFALAQGEHAASATNVAEDLRAWFEAYWPHGRCTARVEGDAERAAFEFTSNAKYASSRGYTVESVAAEAPASAYRASARAGDVLLMEHDGAYPPLWLHALLVEHGATRIRWFSRKEWDDAGPGQELPY